MNNVVFWLKKSIPVFAHLLFWVLIYLFFTYFLGYGSENTEYVNQFSLFLMPVTIAVSYFFFWHLIPNYLLEKKHGLFVLYSIYTFIVATFFIIFSILYGTIFLAHLQKEEMISVTKTIPLIVLGVYFVVFLVMTIGLIIRSYKTAIKNEALQNKFLTTQLQLKEQELKFLKMQIHPHFLFNTLNTLYGFALKKSEKTPEMILKLSNLLDYILYQIEKPTVLLSDEIQHIKDYISLEKMRFQNTLAIRFDVDYKAIGFQITPMLLLPFVENAFKHGTLIDGVLQVDIQLKTSQKELFFSIENSVKENLPSNNGIGLENSKKRLEMLYKNTYELAIQSDKNSFKVTLQVPAI